MPELHGPIDIDSNRRRYECSERHTRAHMTLVTYQTIAGSIISSTVATGHVVFQINTYKEPADKLFLKCDNQLFAEITAIIRSVDVS